MNTTYLPYGDQMKTGRIFGYYSGTEAERLTALGDLLLPRSRRGSDGKLIGPVKRRKKSR